MGSMSVVVVSLLILGGCGHGSGKQIGALLGGAGGGLAAYKLADGKNEKLWAVGGVVAGAWLGSQIGKYLDEMDKKKMAESNQKAIATGRDQSWSNPESKVSGRAEVVSEKTESTRVKVPVLKDRVQEVPPLDMIGESFLVSSNSSMRSGPGNDYKVLETLASGTKVDVIGKVQGQPWMMIGFNNTGGGFMSSDALKAIPVDQQQESQMPTHGEGSTEEVIEKNVEVNRTCRTVQQTITLQDGTEKVENITACQGPNGWEPA